MAETREGKKRGSNFRAVVKARVYRASAEYRNVPEPQARE